MHGGGGLGYYLELEVIFAGIVWEEVGESSEN